MILRLEKDLKYSRRFTVKFLKINIQILHFISWKRFGYVETFKRLQKSINTRAKLRFGLLGQIFALFDATNPPYHYRHLMAERKYACTRNNTAM